MEDVPAISRPRNILQVKPDTELCFRGSFTEVVTTHMKLINPSDYKVCFKVKTTAPRRYCVRPNNGILSPKSSVDVLLRLQPLDKPDSENTKHKFMIQSLVAPSEDITSLDKLWRTATNEQLMYIKLRCAFETPDGARLTNEDINVVTSPNIQQLLRRKVSVDSTTSSTSNISRELHLYHMPGDFEVRNGPVNDEIRRIQQDVDHYRTENKKLKDSERHLHRLVHKPGQKREAVDSTRRIENSSPRPKNEIVYPSIVYIIVALLIGLFIGKFIL